MPVSSTFPPIDIPNVDIWSFLFERKDRPYPDDKIIYQDAETQRHYTYQTLKQRSLTFGHGLQITFQWKQGDVLALFSPNSIDTPVVTWGTLWAGGIISPTNPVYTVDELAFHLRDSGAKALVTYMSVLSVAKAAAKKVGLPEDRILLLGDHHDPENRTRHFSSIGTLPRMSAERPIVEPSRTCAFIVYSSGTTGPPKGVALSHRNIVSNVLQASAGEGGNLTWNGGSDGQGDRVLGFVPFSHIYGLLRLLHAPLYTGYQVFVMEKFEIEKWCAYIQNYRITFSYVVPPVVLLLTQHPAVEKYHLSSLRMLNCSGAPLTLKLVEATYARLGVGIKQGYGCTEVSPTSHNQSWEDWHSTIGSVGKLLPNMEAKYMSMPEEGIDSEPAEVKTGEVGELFLRGPNVFLGYHNNPQATAQTLSADGWLRTGDVGYQDENGHFYITDRVKELIKYNGFQVAPAELESILVHHDAVADVAVIGIQSEEHGTEVPLAFVVRSENSISSGTPAEEEARNIARWLEDRVAYYKQLRGGVHFVDSIPKSPSGKILRRLLKNQVQETFSKGVSARL
ncbi:hypothetical protein ASPVEDRAFT_179986 [Aspergillus versicolor CBS 583.65]|uniref:Phenylacetyl-CoA ligase n=1 Tax=Aspergillus versicolor CBS 583.65 TaxID=1036611 RepID=A0A1L9Q464_ASPVE|nr:uncharacterized protein ASPVEDRAFT_179986 [Aspergillus versicolor CBS 583.65]OJJ08551.1 hypothetical protein ASPVEDRAFT_179986 [Aspergillus versicolor CBS 583.65]